MLALQYEDKWPKVMTLILIQQANKVSCFEEKITLFKHCT